MDFAVLNPIILSFKFHHNHILRFIASSIWQLQILWIILNLTVENGFNVESFKLFKDKNLKL